MCGVGCFSAAFVVAGEFAEEGFEFTVDECAWGFVAVFWVDVESDPADAIDVDFGPCVCLVAEDEDGRVCAAEAVVDGVADGDACGYALRSQEEGCGVREMDAITA